MKLDSCICTCICRVSAYIGVSAWLGTLTKLVRAPSTSHVGSSQSRNRRDFQTHQEKLQLFVTWAPHRTNAMRHHHFELIVSST